MKINHIIYLFESFKVARDKFVQQSGDIEEVKTYLEKFRELAKRNVIEKDISKWISQGWDAFKKAVDDSERYGRSKTEVKRSKNVGKSINIHEDDNWLVVIPLDKDASCFHGKNTDWCTTKPSQPHFEEYFYDKNVTLIYCLNKKRGDKWAIAYHNEIDKFELFDKNDNSIDETEFETATGFDPEQLIKLAKKNDSKLDSSRDEYREWARELKSVDFDSLTQRDKRIEYILMKTKDGELLSKYLKQIGDKAPEQIQLTAIQKDGNSIRHIENPSERVQLAAVKQNGYAIRHIENPSERVQLAAVQQEGHFIKYILAKGITPSERVQLAAVKQNGYAIEYIENPSERVQLAAVQQEGYAIEYIENPSERVQLAAVQQEGYVIKYIIKKGITPSERVQLAAVRSRSLK